MVVVPQESTATQVGQILKDHELIRSPFIFVLYARWKNLDGSLKAGEYLLNNGLSTPEIVSELVDGQLASKQSPFREGYTLAQVAELLKQRVWRARKNSTLGCPGRFPLQVFRGKSQGREAPGRLSLPGHLPGYQGQQCSLPY